jgi:hypothetical protein
MTAAPRLMFRLVGSGVTADGRRRPLYFADLGETFSEQQGVYTVFVQCAGQLISNTTAINRANESPTDQAEKSDMLAVEKVLGITVALRPS